jgi:hypothetical protein
MGHKKKKSKKSIWYRIFGLADSRHTGKLLPANQTSFGALFILLLLLLPNVGLPRGLLGQQTSSGNVTVSLIVTGPPPTSIPTIEEPTATSFNDRFVVVSGTCEYGYWVKILDNNQIVGSTLCDSNGQYGLVITAFVGSNTIIARHYDGLDQAGPDSEAKVFTVTLPVVPTSNAPNSPSTVTLPEIIVDYTVRTINPNVFTEWKISITDGQPPYTLIINWGDGKIETKTITKAGDIMIGHLYTAPGNYTIRLSIKDANGNITVVQFGVVVNGRPTKKHVPSLADTASIFNCGTYTGVWSVAGSVSCPGSQIYKYVPIYWAVTAIIGFIWASRALGANRFIFGFTRKFKKLITPN